MRTDVKRYGTVLRIYDNGGKTLDRYTIIPPREAAGEYKARNGLWDAIGASEYPFQAFGQSCMARPGSHLGKRIAWSALPVDVKRFALQSFGRFCFDVPRIVDGFLYVAEKLAAEDGRPLRIGKAARKTAREFVNEFLYDSAGLTYLALHREAYGWDNGTRDAEHQFGLDLFLTAAGHGTGFWDRDELGDGVKEEGDEPLPGGDIGSKLTDALRGAYVDTDHYRGVLQLHAKYKKD